MLGRLRMSVADAISAYDKLAQDVFAETKRTGQDGKFKASRLEAAIKKIVSDNALSKNPEEPMKEAGVAICRRCVISTPVVPFLYRCIP